MCGYRPPAPAPFPSKQLKIKELICLNLILYTGCPTKHDSWLIVLNVFFHNLLSCLIPKRIIKNIILHS